MSEIRILVVEDSPNWQAELPQILQSVGHSIKVHLEADFDSACQSTADQPYDLAIVDLALLGATSEGQDTGHLGMELLHDLRSSRYNRHCGLIVLTGYPTTARIRQALRDYNADDFIEKNDFDSQQFIAAARTAICQSHLRYADASIRARYRLTIRFNQHALLGCELTGPDRRSVYAAPHPVRFETADLVRRANNLNWMILEGGPERWRPEARSIGEQLYRALLSDQRILGDLNGVRALAGHPKQLLLRLSGSAEGLGVPFELLHDGDDYLGFQCIVTRRCIPPGQQHFRKPERFHAFIEGLRHQHETLRVLIVGANSDDNIPAAEQEAEELATAISVDLERLGISARVTLLVGAEASYEKVSTSLREGNYHIFHYAGHGRYNDVLPEVSGLILHDRQGQYTMTATDLNLLVRNTDLRVVFLSCCLGARTSTSPGYGEFHGALDAIARADVPIVVGYRWSVSDEPARYLALNFYDTLWRTFSPGEALYHARKHAAQGRQGFDDDTWAAPVLVLQNE
ncbi:MAG: CHAT domain-containing protein [Chloroflexales bacterium]|nr:CHAT domain-containing protein [Chloroflexales bacterium]